MTSTQAENPFDSPRVSDSVSLAKKCHPLLAILISSAAGFLLLGVRWLVDGNADPFHVSWPVYLEVGSFLLSLGIAWASRRPLVSSLGIYAGLLVYLFGFGGAEYPVSACIAMTLHGFLPASLAAVVAWLMLCWNRRRS